VAAHAGVQVAHRLEGMVAGTAPPQVGEAGRMEALATPRARLIGPAHDDARALMAQKAEALQVVTVRAAGLVLEGRDRVHREPVVRVKGARADPTVVTVGAVVLGVTARAELRVRRRKEAMPEEEVRRVL